MHVWYICACHACVITCCIHVLCTDAAYANAQACCIPHMLHANTIAAHISAFHAQDTPITEVSRMPSQQPASP